MNQTLAPPSHSGSYIFSWRDAAIAVAVGLVALVPLFLGILELNHFVLIAAALPVLAIIAARPDWGLVMLFGAAALDVMGRLVSVAGVQLTIYQAIAAFLLIVFVTRYRQGRLAWPSTPLDLPLIAFLMLAAASIFVAPALLSSMVEWISLVSSIFLMYAIVAFADTEKKLANLVWWAVGMAAFIAFLALLEINQVYAVQGEYISDFAQGVRPNVTFKDTNILGTLMYVSLSFCGALVLQAKGWRVRGAGLIAAALLMGGLWATRSRGAWIAAIVAALVVLGLSRVSMTLRVLLIAAMVMAAVGVVVLDTTFVENRVAPLAAGETEEPRVNMALAGMRMWLDAPFGIGLGGFPEVYPLYRQGSLRVNLIESHMAYLTLLTETGLFGLLAYLWVLWRFFKSTFRTSRRALSGLDHALLVGAMAAAAGVATQALTYSLEGHKLLWFAMGVGMAVYVRYTASLEEKVEA
jgi:O-antigen ligase